MALATQPMRPAARRYFVSYQTWRDPTSSRYAQDASKHEMLQRLTQHRDRALVLRLDAAVRGDAKALPDVVEVLVLHQVLGQLVVRHSRKDLP